MASIAILICAASFFIYGIANSYLLYCTAASLSGISLGCGGMIPASILISRWFNEHRGLALGICMGATGFSSLAASPVVTFIVGNYTLRIAFFSEAIFIFVVAIIVYALLRSNPSCLSTVPIGASHLDHAKTFAVHNAKKSLYLTMAFGIFIFGIPGNLLSSHISVLYQAAGFAPANISMFLSIYGIALGIGKCSYGIIADKIGTYRASRILYILVLTGTALCCLADNQISLIACIAVIILGLGLAVTSVSISMYASGVATEYTYAQTVSRFQMMSTLGSLIFSAMPGVIADITGSYVPAFMVLFLLALISSVLLLLVYKKILKNDQNFQIF